MVYHSIGLYNLFSLIVSSILFGINVKCLKTEFLSHKQHRDMNSSYVLTPVYLNDVIQLKLNNDGSSNNQWNSLNNVSDSHVMLLRELQGNKDDLGDKLLAKAQKLECEEGSIIVLNICEPCPGGTYWNNLDINSTPQCSECPTGTFSLPGSIELPGCKQCPIGFYSSHTKSPVCESCGQFTTTLIRGSSDISFCFCGAGYRLKNPSIIPTPETKLDCIPCGTDEWCVPGDDVSYWSISHLCGPTNEEKHSICNSIELDIDANRQGKCLNRNQCPSLAAIKLGNTKCLYPYEGVKCNECLSGYSKSLMKGVYGDCVICVYHYIFFALFIIIGSIWSVWISTMLRGRDALNCSSAVSLGRIFAQHWQPLVILRFLNIQWKGEFQNIMKFFTMGIPFPEILPCFFLKKTFSQPPVLIVIQIMCFFPIILLLWGLILTCLAEAMYPTIQLYFKKKKKVDHEVNQPELTILHPQESMIVPVQSNHRGLRFLGIFNILYFTFFVSYCAPFFYGIQCIQLDATGKYHSFVGYNKICNDQTISIGWSLAGIILWIWILPVCIILFLWFKGYACLSTMYSEAWGYFLHGYKREVQVWGLIPMLRLMIMMTIVGFSSSYQPGIMPISFGSKGFSTYMPLPSSDYGSFHATLIISLMYFLTELLRELYCVGIVGGKNNQFLSLIRLSTASTSFSFLAAVLSKIDTSGIIGDSDALTTIPFVDINQQSRIQLVNTSSDNWNAFFCVLSSLLHICFILGCSISIFTQFNQQRHWFVVHCSHLFNFQHGPCALYYKQFKYMSRRLFHIFLLRPPAQFNESHDEMIDNSLGHREPSSSLFSSNWFSKRRQSFLNEMLRSRTIGIIKKEELYTMIECIELSSDRTQTLAALLRLTLEPFKMIQQYNYCMFLLENSGFHRRVIEKPVEQFLQLRHLILERIRLYPEDILIKASWNSRTGCLLRYPVLDHPELQLVPLFRTEIKLTHEHIVGNNISNSKTLGSQSPSTECGEGGTTVKCHSLSDSHDSDKRLAEIEQMSDTGLNYTLWNIGLFFLKGYTPSVQKKKKSSKNQIMSDSIDSKLSNVDTCFQMDSTESFIQELTQRVIQCLLLDLSDYRYNIPRNVTIDRFLASGVPLGTRNDGKTDALIRSYQREMDRRQNAEKPKERPEQEVYLGRVLRKRLERHLLKEDITREGEKKALLALDFAEKENPQLRRKRDLESAIDVTMKFIQIFPDARQAYHSITRIKDKTPDPKKMIIVLQDKTLFPKESPNLSHQETESFNGYLYQLLNLVKNEFGFVNENEEQSHLNKSYSTTINKNQRELQETFTSILFALTSVAGEFSVEPSEIGVYITGHIQYLAGPDGTHTGINTSVEINKQSSSVNHINQEIDDTRYNTSISIDQGEKYTQSKGIILLDPIIELVPDSMTTLIEGEADWSMECWFYLPLTSNSTDTSSNNNIIQSLHTLAAGETKDSLISIQASSGKFGILSTQPNPQFKLFESDGAVIEPVKLSDLDQPCWHFLTTTLECKRTDPTDYKSLIIITQRFYINGKLGGKLLRPSLLRDIESIGNTRDGSQPFGIFSNFCILPKCLSPQDVLTRYKNRRIAAEQKIRMIRSSRNRR